MTLDQAVGINTHRDINDGHEVSHEEHYDRFIEYLGGMDAVIPFLPFSDVIFLADKYIEDPHFNNTPLSAWDLASGFICKGIDAIPTGNGLWRLYAKHGIDCASNAGGVCILKRCAERLALKEIERRGGRTLYEVRLKEPKEQWRTVESTFSEETARKLCEEYCQAYRCKPGTKVIVRSVG